jgi:hypothetical protein
VKPTSILLAFAVAANRADMVVAMKVSIAVEDRVATIFREQCNDRFVDDMRSRLRPHPYSVPAVPDGPATYLCNSQVESDFTVLNQVTLLSKPLPVGKEPVVSNL